MNRRRRGIPDSAAGRSKRLLYRRLHGGLSRRTQQTLKFVQGESTGTIQKRRQFVQEGHLLIGAAVDLSGQLPQEVRNGRIPFAVPQRQIDHVQGAILQGDVDLVNVQHQILVVQVDRLHGAEQFRKLQQKFHKLLPARNAGEIEFQGGKRRDVIVNDVVLPALHRNGRDQCRDGAGGQQLNLLGIELLLPAQLCRKVPGGSLFCSR